MLVKLSDALRRTQQATAEAVDLAGRLQRAGVVEIIEGLPLELLVALEHRMVSSDARMLLEAARVLERMPITKALFAAGRLSWGQVRGIVARLRRLKVADLPSVDQRVEASLELVDKYSPDELVWAVEQAADEIDGAHRVERREQRTVESSFLAVQPSFDGSVRLYGELDPVAGATCLNALEAASDPPDAVQHQPGEVSSRARQRAQGLVRICGDYLGGGSAGPARPLLVAHVDIADVTGTAAGRVELAAPGVLPTLTAATVEALARDGELRVVLFDGARPLAVSAKTRAAHIPGVTRLAVAARDGGCRFPGSTAPAA
ncbi:MAG: 13E12 repeat family protein [Actinomycetota bacterium]|nr:13E12 repeat family protein [Actinomycetota bacterium]